MLELLRAPPVRLVALELRREPPMTPQQISLTIASAAVLALVLGFALGFICGRVS